MQSFQIIKPVPVLSPYIRHYWILQDDAAVSVSERTFPIGCMQLVFHKGKQLFLQNDSKLQPQSFICGQSIGLSEAACLSSKQFGRVFADHVGTTPKEYLRIVRMQRALFLLQQDATLPFVQVAYECGYSDQSHMIKEFKLFSGYTPAEYLSVCAPYSDYFSEF